MMGRWWVIGVLATAAPATHAQPQSPGAAAPPKLGEQIIRDCREGLGEDEVVVCGRPERSPFRLPPSADRFDPDGPIDSVSRERHRLIDHGAFGIGSCSTVGPGGWTGCDLIKWKQEHEQKDGTVGVGLRARRPKWDYGRDN